MDRLVELDHQFTLYLHHLGVAQWDGFWIWVTERSTWYPLYAVLIALFFILDRRRGWIALVAAITCVGLSDALSVHAFKEVFQRLRPCHDPAVAPLLREVSSHCSGLYGFVSSHAANGFSMAVFFGAYFGRHWKPAVPLFLTWGGFLAYSRVYLGVHFVGDILGGAILGLAIGWASWGAYRFFAGKNPANVSHTGSPPRAHGGGS